jgi:hypothetical protein
LSLLVVPTCCCPYLLLSRVQVPTCCCPYLLSLLVVHTCCPYLLSILVVHTCCPYFLLSLLVVPTCCPYLLSLLVVPTCCPYLLSLVVVCCPSLLSVWVQVPTCCPGFKSLFLVPGSSPYFLSRVQVPICCSECEIHIDSNQDLPHSTKINLCVGPNLLPGVGPLWWVRTFLYPCSSYCFGFDHINRNPPVLIRTPKLTRFEPAQYWGGGPPGNSVVLNPTFLLFVFVCFFLVCVSCLFCSLPTSRDNK